MPFPPPHRLSGMLGSGWIGKDGWMDEDGEGMLCSRVEQWVSLSQQSRQELPHTHVPWLRGHPKTRSLSSPQHPHRDSTLGEEL